MSLEEEIQHLVEEEEKKSLHLEEEEKKKETERRANQKTLEDAWHSYQNLCVQIARLLIDHNIPPQPLYRVVHETRGIFTRVTSPVLKQFGQGWVVGKREAGIVGTNGKLYYEHSWSYQQDGHYESLTYHDVFDIVAKGTARGARFYTTFKDVGVLYYDLGRDYELDADEAYFVKNGRLFTKGGSSDWGPGRHTIDLEANVKQFAAAAIAASKDDL